MLPSIASRVTDPIGWLIRMVRSMGFEYVFKRYYGIYRGIVIDTEDPEGLGRARVRVPATGQRKNDDVPNGTWAWLCQDGLSVGDSGQLHGSYFPYNEGDQVWVSFEGGKVEYPVIVGGWNPKNGYDDGTLRDSAGKVKGIRTSTGHLIRFDDNDGSLSLRISKGDGDGGEATTFVMTEDDEIVALTAHSSMMYLSEKEASLVAPDGSSFTCGQGKCQMISGGGDVFAFDGGELNISCESVTFDVAGQILLKGEVKMGKGPVYEPVVMGQTFGGMWAGHVHTSNAPSLATTPQVGPPLAPKTGLSESVYVSS